jgi:serine/threonine protein kinase
MVHAPRKEPLLSSPGPIRDIDDSSALLGQVFDNRYRVLELVGRGGMSVVYKAIQLSAQDIVALKVMTRAFGDDDRHLQRFNQEALACSRLRHPNTIKVFDYGQSEDGHLFIAMEFLEGRTLAEELKLRKRLDARRVCLIALQICNSLAEAHRAGIVHRDLKPDNVFLLDKANPDAPGADYVKVLDFGIAKFMAEGVQPPNLTRTGFICGTPLYIAPEQGLDDPIDHRSDLYSLGVILFECLAGVPPFRADTPVGVVLKHINEPPPDLRALVVPRALPRSVEELVHALLEKRPIDRPSSADELRSILLRMLESGDLGEPETMSDTMAPDDEDDNSPTRIMVQSTTHPGGMQVASMPHNERPTMFLSVDEVDAGPPRSPGPPPPPPPRPMGVVGHGGASISRLPDSVRAAEERALRRLGPVEQPHSHTQILMGDDPAAPGRTLIAPQGAAPAAKPPGRRAETLVALPTQGGRQPAGAARRGKRVGLLAIAGLAAVGSVAGAFWVYRTKQADQASAEAAAAAAQAAAVAQAVAVGGAPLGQAVGQAEAPAPTEQPAGQAAAQDAPPAVVDLAALAAGSAAPAPGPGADAAPGAGEAAPAAAAPSAVPDVGAPPSNAAPVNAGAVPAAAAPEVGAPPVAAGAPPGAQDAAVEPLAVMLVSTPPGAEVWERDVRVGRTPMSWTWTSAEAERTLRATHPGHLESSRKLTRAELREGQRVEFRLEPDPSAVAAKPADKRTENAPRKAAKVEPGVATERPAKSAPAVSGGGGEEPRAKTKPAAKAPEKVLANDAGSKPAAKPSGKSGGKVQWKEW